MRGGEKEGKRERKRGRKEEGRWRLGYSRICLHLLDDIRRDARKHGRPVSFAVSGLNMLQARKFALLVFLTH